MASYTNSLESIVSNHYGVDINTADPIVIEWAATRLAIEVGAFQAGQSWKKANRKRQRAGRYTTYPCWHHPLFEAYFAKDRADFGDRTAARAKRSSV